MPLSLQVSMRLSTVAAASPPRGAADEEIGFTPDGNWAHTTLDQVGVRLEDPHAGEPHQRSPVRQHVPNRAGHRPLRQQVRLDAGQPLAKLAQQRSSASPSLEGALIGRSTSDLAFDLVEFANPSKRVMRQARCRGRSSNVEEPPPCVDPACGVIDPLAAKQGVVARVVIGLKVAAVAGQKPARVLAAAITGELVEGCLRIVDPDALGHRVAIRRSHRPTAARSRSCP